MGRRRRWHPTPVLLPGKSHGRKGLVDYSPWGCEESDTTERPHFHFSFSCIGEGNGNPLQCSCLENPRDGEAAISGIAQSRTQYRVGHSTESDTTEVAQQQQQFNKVNEYNLNFKSYLEFLGGLAAGIPSFHCCGLGSIPARGSEILQAVHSVARKKRSFLNYFYVYLL